MNSRRAFLKRSLLSTVPLALPDAFLQFFSFREENNLPSWSVLIDYARWCPSVHNLQPHKIKIITATEAELYYDPARLLPVGDPGGIFATVALGIFIEHLSIVAGAYEARVQVAEVFNSIETSANGYTLFAKLKIVPTNEKEYLQKELIKKRRTSRLHYTGDPVLPETLEKIKAQAAEFDHGFFSSSEQEVTDFIIDRNQQTLFEDLKSDASRTELDHLFRYSKQEAEAQKDGLWTKCMGFSGALVKSVFTNYEKWGKGYRKRMLRNRYKSAFKGTNTIGWFEGRFDTTNDWLQAGKMLARNWLLITKEGAYIQPFGSLITNKNACRMITEKFKQSTDEKKLWLIFRIGYSEEPARSYRLSTEEILIH